MTKKTDTGKFVKNAKRVVKGVRVADTAYHKVLPWVLVAFAAAAYFFLDVPIPDRKMKIRYWD